MSLPTGLVQHLKNIPYNPQILSNDPELSYILSFISHPISNQSVYFHPRDTYQSPLTQYQFADFDNNTYEHLFQQTTKNYKSKNVSVVKGIRSSFKQFYARTSALTYQSALKYNEVNVLNDQKTFQTSKIELDYRIQTMKGNIPSKWPQGLHQFKKQLSGLPWNALSTESQLLQLDFISQIKSNISNNARKFKNIVESDRTNSIDKITQQFQVLIGIALRTLSQPFILEQILFIQQTVQTLQVSKAQQLTICQKISNVLKQYITILPKQKNQATISHSLDKFWDKNAFLVMKKIHFHKIPGLAHYSVTTDGKYLFVFVSAINGGMYKFGTGNNGTIAGKLYHQKCINLPVGTKVEEVNWVYLKGKLYLKSSNKDPSNLDVISPQDFKKIGSVQLACKSLFGQSVLITLNKNSILMTDGQNLYFLGKRIKITQNNQISKTKSQQKKQDPQNDKTNKKKKKKKNNEAQNTQAPNTATTTDANQQPTRILEIVLAQFDISGKIEQNKHEIIDQDSINQIFQSFSGYFTKQQCKRAYRLNHYDIMQACQWLFDQGSKQKDKNIKILPAQKVNVICQAEITSNFNQKTFKSAAQIVTKQGSVLHMYNINQSIWTMDTQQITCYSQNGVKVFRKNQIQAQQSKNKINCHNSLLISKKDNKHPRNPQYTIVHDPYNKLFYTFSWHNDGRYFPCPVLVSKDKKQQISLQIKRRSSVDTSLPQRINQLARFYATQLCLLQNIDKTNFKFNDHLWWYGQKLKEINTQTNCSYEQKKKISNKKAKLITKINKINEITQTYQKDIIQFNEKGTVKKQIIKIYPFSSDGTLTNLNQILLAFQKIQDCSQNGLIAAFLIVIEKWLKNCSFLHSQALERKIFQVLAILLKIRNGPLTSQQNKHQINKIIIKNFFIFYKKKQQAIQFFIELSSQQIQSFLKAFDGNSFVLQKQYILYELSKKDLIINKFDSKHNLNEIFKQKSSVPSFVKNNIVSNLLLRKESKSSPLQNSLLLFLQNCIVNLDSSLIMKFFTTLFLCSFKQISQIKKSQQKIKCLKNLFQDTFKIFQKCLSSVSFSKTIQLAGGISYIVQLYHSSIIRMVGDQNIIRSLLKIIQLIQKPQLVQYFAYIKNSQYEGISAIQQKIYQTSHPLERGKSQSFPSAYFPQSSLMFLQFDKRCQSDTNHDIMSIQLLHGDQPVGNSIPCNDGRFTTNLRLTGKIQMKRPVLMLGNNVSVDFTSSGHAKDAQSFGRFGFKFGLRPVIAGKISYDKHLQNGKIQKTFNNKNNFISYINTLKFLVVATSASIQNIFNVEQDECSNNIKKLLKGKIMRQGLQQTKKNQNQQNINLTQIINKFLSKQHEDPEKNIIKNLNIDYLSSTQPKIQKINTQNEQKDLWAIQGIPSYIKGYIEQIKKFKGDFVEVFKQARQHAPPQGSYFAQLRRPGFTTQLKQLWLQGQALLFLTVLKHSGLLHLNLKFSIQYIKQNLKAFQQARNGIFYAFITRMQTVREWRDLVQTFQGKKQDIKIEQKKQGEVQPEKKALNNKKGQISIRKNNRVIRTVNFQNKVSQNNSIVSKKVGAKIQQKAKQQNEAQKKKQIQKQIRERLNNQFLVYQICQLKGITYVQNNIFQNSTRILQEIKKINPDDDQIKRSVYYEPIQHLIKGCLFLLSCKSPSTRQSLEQDNDIVPMALGRSLSSDNRNADKNKVQLFREWLQNWKKWKGFKKQNKIELKFPVLQIVQFINSWTKLDDIKQSINKRSKMCEYRIQYYKNLSQLLKSTNQFVFLNKYVFGSQILNLVDSFKSNLQSAPLAKLELLGQVHSDYIKTIKDIQNKFIRDQLPISYKKFLRYSKSSSSQKGSQFNYKRFLQKIRVNSQILYMIQSQNPFMSLDIALYFINFKFLSNQNQQILFLASLITQRAFLVEHQLEEILSAIKKQVGNNHLSAKRWKDLLFIQRISFLLRKLESLVQRKNLEIDTKQKVAQTLFYLINLTQIPFISRVSLKILKKLKDVNFINLPTIYNCRYKKIKINQHNKAIQDQCFSVSNQGNLNNIQLLNKKSLSIFKGNQFRSNQVQIKLLQNDNTYSQQIKEIKEQSKEKIQTVPNPQNCNIILSLHHEEDLIWLLRVLFYIQQLQRQSGKGNISQLKDWKEYLDSKNTKQNKKNQQQQANNNPQQNANQQQAVKTQPQKNSTSLKDQILKQRILTCIPQKIKQIDAKLQEQMPIAWYMNYCDIFNELSLQKHLNKSTKQQVTGKPTKSNGRVSYANNANQNNPNKKAWPSAQFLKVTKKFDEFNSKPLQEPKETDSQQIKQQFLKAKNLISRIRRHLAQVSSLINQFTNYGYVVFRQDIPKQKALELCHLIALGSQNRLLPIKTQFNKEDYKTRILIQDSVTTVSKIKITLIGNQNYQIFEELISLESAIPIQSDNPLQSYIQINKREYILQDSSFLPYEEFFKLQEGSDQKDLNFCREFIESKIFKMKKRQQQVYLSDYPKLKYFISQGGIQTGLKNVSLVPASQSSLTIQSIPIDDVLTAPNKQNQQQADDEFLDFPQQIIQKLINLLKQTISRKSEGNKDDMIRDYLLISFYLKKLSKMDLKFINKESLKNLASLLVQFSQGFKSYQPIQHYQSEIQKLLIKYIDNRQSNLKIFEIFNSSDYQISPNIAGFITKSQKLQKNNEIKTQIKQDLTTYHYPKSQYLLKSQPPQIQQNKLLKYWDKNILPRILEFVKTTLRPIQIEDFFQQMRIPLRKNDQMEAKKIAYVICDNKLPQGAVLPDSNHNWNSFTVQDIHVGQYALLKLPKHSVQSISPLLMTGNQQYRLVKIIFIDVKTPSILVRYRIDQYSIMSYIWVPINSLVRVQKQIMHLSPKDLSSQIQKNLKGMIYGYSKLCLTQLTSVSNLDQTKLIKQTITDMFINNPISGWLQESSHQWSMRHALKKMLSNNQLQIINYLQKQFCPVSTVQTDLFTQDTVKLNKFQNATALILSFKKTAALSLSSGIKFYKDPYLFNQIMHIYTTKSQKTQFQPLIFNDPNVYCKYYTNKECLKIADQNKYAPKPIQATVFGVSQIWTIGCYLGEVISQICVQENTESHLQILKRICRLYVKWILQKKVAVLCSELSKLVSRIANRIILISQKLNKKLTFQSFGIDQKLAKQLIDWVRILLQEQQKTPSALYSSLLQNLSQMVAVILRKIIPYPKIDNVPQHIEAMVNLMNVLQRIEHHLKGNKITQHIQDSGQWQRFLLIEKIPPFVERKQLITKIKQLIKQNKGKILSPKFDIFFKDDKLIICVEGWNITQLVEEQIVEKIQKQQEEQQKLQQQEQGLIMEWACQACTFINAIGNSHCQLCGNQMPPAPVAKQVVYQQVQATDVKKAQNKLKDLQAKRFETIKSEILKFFDTYWQQQCKKIQKHNKDLQTQVKNKALSRKKQQKKQQQKKRQIPQKPNIQLKTGSQILKQAIIQQFLQYRFTGFKQNVKKLVQNETTFVDKFKKLQNLGYDLWCDHIYHQNPVLIPFQRLYQLMNYIQGQICKGSSSVLSYSQNSIRLLSTIPLLSDNQQDQPINYQAQNNIGVKTKYKNLAEIPSYNVRYSWKIVKELNVAASKCLQFINMNLSNYDFQKQKQTINQSDSLGYKTKFFRNLIMGAIKLQLNQKIIQKTSVLRQPEEMPKIYLERLKVRQQRGKDHKLLTIKDKEDYLFTKSHEQFSKVSPAMLRPFKPKGTDPYLSFSITFRGQMAMGQAGPYRQFFTDISNQLDPKSRLGLFIPTPNNKHNTGQARSKWLINPKANSSYHLSLFQYLGILMGCCLRTGTHLALDLPKLFWKLIVNEKITDADLEEVDHQLLDTLKMIKDIPNQQMFEQFQQYYEPITWTYKSSDEQEHQIVYNGKNIKVTFDERQKYISQVKRKRICESILQINRIKKGLQQMMPQSYFNCITGDQIKLMVCGRPKVDVDLLKKHTKYAGGLNQEERRIKYFWQVMRQIEEADKLKVIKFCWGQQRLPINSQQFQRNNIRFMIKPMMNQKNNDQSLPKADTCFFNIELPNYSTKEIMKQKLLLAINMDCVSINADQNFNPDDNPLMNEIEDDVNYDEGQQETEW